MTGNRTKLAHLRHIARDFPVPINLFHELTYHASYTEPRIYNREQLLKESVDSAIEQIKKANIGSPNKLFLIEDTSVIIEALSTSEREFPGLDVKYWMKGIEFDVLDQELKNHGNRNVTVRSDMVIFNIDKTMHKHFTGFSRGSIVKQQQKIETHLLYSWLDNKTFNKWFVPNGESCPISLLPINRADKADFRKKTFDQVVSYLLENNCIEAKLEVQPDLFTTSKLILVTGYSCAGKTTLAQYISKRFGARHIEASDFMRVNFLNIHGLNSSFNIEKFASVALKLEPEIVAEKIIKDIEEYEHQTDIVVTGFRSPDEVEFIRDQLSDRYDIHVIKMEADFETRYQRALLRKREGDATQSRDAFELKDKSQKSMGIELFAGLNILNTSSFEDLFSKFLELNANAELVSKKNHKHVFTPKIGDLKLSVMTFLYDYYDVSGQGKFFSTTEISKYIPSHKDNISRFFNQSYSADFEVKNVNGTSKYRLSNTGYSKLVTFSFV